MSGPGSLIAVVGPTAAGKTALAVALAEAAGGEVVSCDALQLRQGLPILTAKPSAEELRRVRHHLIDVLDLRRPATAAQYVALADRAIATLWREGKAVVLCGGTGLYLRALVQGLFAGPAAAPALRAALRAEAAERGTQALHERLQEIDPAAAARIAPADYVRIERALEVFLLTGRRISDLQDEGRARAPRYEIVRIGLDPGPDQVRRRIELRVQKMIDLGLCEEVAQVDSSMGPLGHPPLGYHTVLRHLRGELTLPRMREELVQETTRYAKRQRTWFRREPDIRWYREREDVEVAELLTSLGLPVGPAQKEGR